MPREAEGSFFSIGAGSEGDADISLQDLVKIRQAAGFGGLLGMLASAAGIFGILLLDIRSRRHES